MRVWQVLSLLVAFHGFRSARADLVDEIVDAIEQAVDCAACHALLVPMKVVADLGDTPFSDTLIEVCEILGVEDDDVCSGLLSQQGPILAHDLRSISTSGQTATKLCEAVFGLCQPPPVNQFTFPLPPAPANPKQWTSSGRTPIQVAHFSDVHIDREYTPGAEVNCTKNICCRNYADQAGKPIEVPAGPLASHNCDTSTGVVESMLRAASADENSFSIFTGDVIAGDVWLVNETGNTAYMEQFNQEMQTLLDFPVFPAIGNHEAAPVNSYPRNTSSGALSSQWVYDTQSAGWTKWLDATATDLVQHMSGSYSMIAPGTNLRIISMNTNYWYKANLWMFDSDTLQPDPNGILTFVAEQLQATEDAGQRAWLMGHMPLGTSDALHDQSNYFDQIVQRYQNTIAGQFYGHTHLDEFQISYSDYSNRTAENAVSTMLISPSVTPSTGNSAFRVYDIDPDTFEVMDLRGFIGNLSDPTFQTSPQWQPYYSAREVYGAALPGGWPATTPLTPAFWHMVTEAFEENDALYQQFLAFKTRGYNIQSCPPGDCKTQLICALRAGRAEDNCHVTTPGLNFRRRSVSETGVVSDVHCEGKDIGTILSRMPEKLAQIDTDVLKERLRKSVPGLAQ